MKKVLFWDFDGTLIHAESRWSKLFHGALEEHGCHIELQDVRQHLNTGYTWHTPENDYCNATGEAWWTSLFRHCGLLYSRWGLDEGTAAAVNQRFRSGILDAVNYTAYGDAPETLQRCLDRGYRNYILSNNFPELELVAEALGIAGYFDGMVVSANIGYEKPRVELFDYARRLAGLPDVCYMVGDNPVADIQGARAAGMRTILVHSSENTGADHLCENLLDIPDLLP